MAKVRKKSKSKKVKAVKKSISKSKILDVLQGSTKFRTDVSLLILRFDPKRFVEFLADMAIYVDRGSIVQVAQGSNAVVVLCEEPFANVIEKKYPKMVIEHKKDLVALVLMSPKKIVNTPGVLSFVLEMFAKNKINVVEIIGTYTDTTFVISRKDLFRTMELLGEFVL